LKNKKIVIVGGSSGIGFAVAQKALAAGANVLIAGRSETRLAGALAQLQGNVSSSVLDASNEEAVIDFFASVGEFDHLAATIKPELPAKSFLENDTNAVRAACDAKFWGQYYLAKHGAKLVREGGSITLTSGIASTHPYPGYSAVSVMNAAVESLSRAIAIELAPIRVNTVCPGFVNATTQQSSRVQYVKKLAPNLPLNRLADAAEIADAYLYLFNSTYSTGTVLLVDGGAGCV
jgi:NAD(P)-dependent dehydrogenase (short-subunit alcohol dehydrogenase family)